MPENKVVSLDERAKDEEKPFLEQLLQEGARKLLQGKRLTNCTVYGDRKFRAAQAVGVSSATRLIGKSARPGSTEPR